MSTSGRHRARGGWTGWVAAGGLAVGLLASSHRGSGVDPAPVPVPGPVTAPLVGGGLPVGSIIAFGGPAGAVPENQGWMLCDGREVQASAFPELQSVVGRAWGGSPGTGTLRLPDLRGRFLRGVNYDGDGPMRDPDRATRAPSAPGGNEGNEVGSLQEDAAGPHVHGLVGAGDATGSGYGGQVLRFYAMKAPDENAPLSRNDGAVQPPPGLETRPRNVGVNWIIRVR